MTLAKTIAWSAMALALITSAEPVARMRNCDQESNIVAQRSTRATTLWFRNHARGPRKLFWLNFDGERVYYATVAPGERVEQPTYAGHPWVVTDRRGACIAIFIATGRSGPVDID